MSFSVSFIGGQLSVVSDIRKIAMKHIGPDVVQRLGRVVFQAVHSSHCARAIATWREGVGKPCLGSPAGAMTGRDQTGRYRHLAYLGFEHRFLVHALAATDQMLGKGDGRSGSSQGGVLSLACLLVGFIERHHNGQNVVG